MGVVWDLFVETLPVWPVIGFKGRGEVPAVALLVGRLLAGGFGKRSAGSSPLPELPRRNSP